MDPAVLRAFPLLKNAAPATLDRLAEHTVERHGAFAEHLWTAGTPSTNACFLRRGLIQIVRLHANGDETTLALFGPREAVGLTAALDGFPYPADAVVASEVADVLLIPAVELLAALKHDHDLALSAATALAKQTVVMRQKVEVLSAGEVPQRIALLLLGLCERFGDDFEDGTTLLPIPLTRRTLARLVGARAETVTRVMTRWEREGMLATLPDGLHLYHCDELRSLAGT